MNRGGGSIFLENIDPVAFSIGPVEVRWYGIIMALVMFAGTAYFLKEGRERGLNEDHLLTLSLWAIISGLAGARLMFVAANFPYWFWSSPLEVLKVYEGGLAWHGGLLGGMLGGWIYLRRRPGLEFNVLADLAVPGIALGYAMIRFANIINDEVIGRSTGLGFDRWPAQLVGAGIGLFLLVRYFYLAKRPLPHGYQFWSFVLYHQVLRGAVEETVREMPLLVDLYTSTRWGVAFLTAAQAATFPIILFALYMLQRLRRSGSSVNS